MFNHIKAVLFDLDGTIYHGSALITGAKEAVEHCRALGKRVFFLTNNSARTRLDILEKLQRMGIACSIEDVMTAGYVSALYVKQAGLDDLYVCGTDSLCREVSGMGIAVAESDDARNLLIGYNPGFDYEALTDAVRVALTAETIIACNKERTYKGEGGRDFPGCGAMVASVEWCANRKVDYLVGKPNRLFLETFAKQHGYGRDDLLMVGDTYESDVRMANDFGCPSVLINAVEQPGTFVVREIGQLPNLIG